MDNPEDSRILSEEELKELIESGGAEVCSDVWEIGPTLLGEMRSYFKRPSDDIMDDANRIAKQMIEVFGKDDYCAVILTMALAISRAERFNRIQKAQMEKMQSQGKVGNA